MSNAAERVGRYQLLEPIGTGPCGVVSRAKVFGVAGFERQFAVKRFHPELTITTALAQALSAAARAYGSLEHPRIARMSEFGVAQGTTFTAVEYVAGLDAARLVAEARLAGSTLAAGGALALVSQAARAVGYAHGRGLTHLGLAPTNVLVNVEGDVKITDFGILAAGMPQRPIDVARLQHRVQYLAPEQVANEATSAATDVFALGVIAYELVTGQRTFKGETPQQIAQSIMQGPPPEPPLPRPIVRVLQRCLARSPFERFPDARALADALDAAIRVAPVPGTRKDIGAQVKTITERLAALHESEMSGMVALHVGTGPVARSTAPDVATLGAASARGDALDPSTTEFVRPDVPVPGPTPLVGPAATMPEMPKPAMTLTGLAPPPIPVPPGVGGAPPSIPPPPPSGPGQAGTLLGIPTVKAPPQIPSLKAPKSTDPGTGQTLRPPAIPASRNTPPPLPVVAPPPPAAPRKEDSVVELMLDDEPASAPIEIAPPAPPAPADEHSFETPTSAMSPLLADRLGEASRRETEEVAPLVEEAVAAERDLEIPSGAVTEPPGGAPPNRADTEGVLVSPPTRPSTPSAPPPARVGQATELVRHPSAPSTKRSPLVPILAVVGLGALGAGGWFVYQSMQKDDGANVATATTDARAADPKPVADAGPVVVAPSDAAARSGTDAAAIAVAPADAANATATAVDAAVVTDAATVAVAPTDAAEIKPSSSGGSSDTLAITSSPAGARVYVDGSDAGVTPVKLPGSPDRHEVALLLPGHELYLAKIDGSGNFQITLKEVTPSGGPAGIKVIKCKDKDRYYVYVDGKPTGMMCPTERIETDLGPHTVEVYDAVTETRKRYDIVVKDTRLSHRVKIE